MELTIDDCLALAAREHSTEHELRAAVCVAVGQALHYRYEARGYSDAAETAKRDADRAREAFSLRLSAAERERDEARAERDASDERWATVCRECDVALAERDAVQALHAELVATRADFVHQRDITEDALRERDDARAALDLARESAREAREEIAQSLALVDEARAALDAALARPTYEARTTMPTPEELAAHDAAGGGWLVSWGGERYRRATVFWSGFDPSEWTNAGHVWIAFDASGLPCAWPVAP